MVAWAGTAHQRQPQQHSLHTGGPGGTACTLEALELPVEPPRAQSPPRGAIPSVTPRETQEADAHVLRCDGCVPIPRSACSPCE